MCFVVFFWHSEVQALHWRPSLLLHIHSHSYMYTLSSLQLSCVQIEPLKSYRNYYYSEKGHKKVKSVDVGMAVHTCTSLGHDAIDSGY